MFKSKKNKKEQKTKLLVSLEVVRHSGAIVATWYDIKDCCNGHMTFIDYNKEDIIRLLRNEYGVVVPKSAECYTGYY